MWLHPDQEHCEAHRHHDERDHGQNVFHEDSDRILCFAVTSVAVAFSRPADVGSI
jgi:hypothetical protein